jgi:hypothetical protein
VQGAFIALLSFPFMLVLHDAFDYAEWYVVASAMFFYSAISPMIGSFWPGRFRKYILLSVLVFLAMGALLWFAAGKLADQPFTEVREVRLLFTVITIFFFVITGLSVLYRAVMNYVKRI